MITTTVAELVAVLSTHPDDAEVDIVFNYSYATLTVNLDGRTARVLDTDYGLTLPEHATTKD